MYTRHHIDAMNVATRCTSPHAVVPACCIVPRTLTLEEQIRRDPSLTAEMGFEAIILNVPLGSMLFIEYHAGSRGGAQDGASDRPEGMPRAFYFGRLCSRESHGDHVVFRLLCTLTRGEPGKPVPRTFSTRVGTLGAVRFMELPGYVEAA